MGENTTHYGKENIWREIVMGTNISVGDSYNCRFSFTQKDVLNFAKASGDYNPIHLDENYAIKTIFKKPILHGFLGASIFSKVFGTEFPGHGTIYLKQDINFLKPMYVEEQYLANFEIISVIKDKKRAKVKTQVLDINDDILIDGEALIQHDKIG